MLIVSLETALEQVSVLQNWDICCKEAVRITQKTPAMRSIKASQTIRNWYREFRDEGQTFSAIPYFFDSKITLPCILIDNSKVCLKLEQYTRENLAQMSI